MEREVHIVVPSLLRNSDMSSPTMKPVVGDLADEIRRRANDKWTKRSQPENSQLSDWLEAESELVSEMALSRHAYEQSLERAIGREIQQSLLPTTVPQCPGMEIGGKSLAPNMVGGDCFDFIRLQGINRELLGVFVGDASGHGIGSALLIVRACSYLRGVALTVSNVSRLLTLTNECLCTHQPTCHFVTAFLMTIDRDNCSLNYSSAGHLPGYILDQRGATRAILRSTGMPLGLDPVTDFPSSSILLEPGDLVLLITDGVTEAASPDRELFGMERALCVVREHRHLTPDEIITHLFAAVTDHAKDNCIDDMTAVVIKVDGLA